MTPAICAALTVCVPTATGEDMPAWALTKAAPESGFPVHVNQRPPSEFHLALEAEGSWEAFERRFAASGVEGALIVPAFFLGMPRGALQVDILAAPLRAYEAEGFLRAKEWLAATRAVGEHARHQGDELGVATSVGGGPGRPASD